MKPWEETWDERGDVLDLCADEKPYGSVCVGMIGRMVPRDGEPAAQNVERCRLAALAPEMARMLLAREWSGAMPEDYYGTAGQACEACGQSSNRDGIHRPDCAWLALMKKCGAR